MAKQESKFRQWYEKESTKTAVNAIYSVGASVVIIGALFKIMHWPGAGAVLTVGMCTESFLFFLSVFDKVHVEYKWDNIFPALLSKEPAPITSFGQENVADAHPNRILTSESPVQQVSVVSGGKAGGAQNLPSIAEEDVKLLEEGIKNIGSTAKQLASIGKVADSTSDLTTNMSLASQAAAQFAGSQSNLAAASDGLGQAYQNIINDMVNTGSNFNSRLGQAYDAIVNDMKNAAANTQTYGSNMQALNTQMASLNSAYELQLQNINNIAAEINKLQQATATTAAAAQKYTEGTEKLAAQIADLNKVYGGMLNALN